MTVKELSRQELIETYVNNVGPITWNPWNKVVQDHRDGTIFYAATNAVRDIVFRLPVPWSPSMNEDVTVQVRLPRSVPDGVPIDTASVKVMRSFDYCHFEVCLSLSEPQTGLKAASVDELRKTAARLADKAVEQYKEMKKISEKLQSEEQNRGYLVQRMKTIEEMPEGQRTVGQQAELKAFKDANWQASREYDYEDDWEN